MKKIIYLLAILILSSCNIKTKMAGIKAINTNDSVYEEESKTNENEVILKSPKLKNPSFTARKLDYQIIKPDFLLKSRFKDIKTQDKFGKMMMEYFDEENSTFYVSRILTEAIKDPNVSLKTDFDGKMEFISDLFLLSPFYSQGMIEPYIYYDYYFNENTFYLENRVELEDFTKTYISKEEKEIVDKQIETLVDYANKNYTKDYDKAYYFAQWLAENNQYQYKGSNNDYIENNIYGAFVKGKSQCSGFAQSFTILCQKVGIPCYSVTGNTDHKYKPDEYSADHQWNVIKLGDDWSYVDITGMVANGSDFYYYYFDRSKNELTDYYISEFFNDIEDYIR